MSANRNSIRLMIVFAAVSAIGGFLAGSSRSQVQEAAPASEVGRYQFSVGQSVTGNQQVNCYVIFDTKTARAWEMQIRYGLDNSDIAWTAIPSPLDPDKKIVYSSPGNPDEKSESN